jgi:cell division septum initiation protein DivIVA
MPPATTQLKEEHRALEEHLDALLAAIRSGDGLVESFRRAEAPAAAHYRQEESFLERFSRYEPVLAAKMAAQHAEAMEIAARLEEAIAAGQSSDVLSLARRFHAIAQHNIIEEERDVFPLAARCFQPGPAL